MKKQYIYIRDLERDYIERFDKRYAKINRLFKRFVVILAASFIVMAIYNTSKWPDNIKNPANEPYLQEIAFNLGISVDSVTQKQFNERYGKPNQFTIKPAK